MSNKKAALLHAIVLLICYKLPCGWMNDTAVHRHVSLVKNVIVDDFAQNVYDALPVLNSCDHVFGKFFNVSVVRCALCDIGRNCSFCRNLCLGHLSAGESIGFDVVILPLYKHFAAHFHFVCRCRPAISKEEFKAYLIPVPGNNWSTLPVTTTNPRTLLQVKCLLRLLQLAFHDGKLSIRCAGTRLRVGLHLLKLARHDAQLLTHDSYLPPVENSAGDSGKCRDAREHGYQLVGYSRVLPRQLNSAPQRYVRLFIGVVGLCGLAIGLFGLIVLLTFGFFPDDRTWKWWLLRSFLLVVGSGFVFFYCIHPSV